MGRFWCYAAAGSRYPRSAFWTSPVLASLDSVVDTVGRARPALVATWPAVSASPPASAASTDVLVAPRVVRPLVADFEAAVRRVRVGRVADAAGLGLAARVRLRAGAVRTGVVGVDVEDAAGCQPWPSRLT